MEENDNGLFGKIRRNLTRQRNIAVRTFQGMKVFCGRYAALTCNFSMPAYGAAGEMSVEYCWKMALLEHKGEGRCCSSGSISLSFLTGAVMGKATAMRGMDSKYWRTGREQNTNLEEYGGRRCGRCSCRRPYRMLPARKYQSVPKRSRGQRIFTRTRKLTESRLDV